MTINATFLGYKEEDYVSKKTGNPSIARELSVLTDNKELLVFGYDSFGKESITESFTTYQPGQAIILSVEVRPNKYNRNYPRLVVIDSRER